MINTSISLGPFSIPFKLILFAGAAGTVHLIFFIVKRKESELFKKSSDLFFNSVIFFILGWRLSLILSNWSTFKGAPSAVLYLPGGFVNHLAGVLLALLVGFFMYKKTKYSLQTMVGGGILISGSLILYFLLSLGFSSIAASSTPGASETGKSTSNSSQKEEINSPGPQSSVSDISLINMEGEEKTLILTETGVTIVNFWASWCPPCRAEIPEIERFYSDYKDSDIKIIAVNMTSTEKSIQNVMDFMDKEKFTFPVLLDHKAEAAAYFTINSLPSTYVFNRKGELIAQKTGAVDYAWLKKASRLSR